MRLEGKGLMGLVVECEVYRKSCGERFWDEKNRLVDLIPYCVKSASLVQVSRFGIDRLTNRAELARDLTASVTLSTLLVDLRSAEKHVWHHSSGGGEMVFS